MKKLLLVLFGLVMAFSLITCGSAPPPAKATGGQPQWVRDARKNAPEDVIVGIGQAKLATDNQSMNTSETRARAQISRAMNSMIENMIEDMTVSSEIDPSAAIGIQTEITQALSRSKLQGAKIYDQSKEADGTWWTVIYMSKAESKKEINMAAAAAKLAPAAAIAAYQTDKMDARFKDAASKDWSD